MRERVNQSNGRPKHQGEWNSFPYSSNSQAKYRIKQELVEHEMPPLMHLVIAQGTEIICSL